jgi:hypothetical protein
MRLALIAFAALSTTAFAADLGMPKKSLQAVVAPASGFCVKPPAAAPVKGAPVIAQVPGGDLFGITSATDVGSVGDCAVAFEYTGRAGKPDGSYFAGTLKNQYSATIAENLAVAFSPFVSHTRISGVTNIGTNYSTLDFDGFSAEASYRMVERALNNPIAVTLSLEPRWAKMDGLTGSRLAKNIGVEFKLFSDAVLIKDTLFAAVNLNYALGTFRGTDPASVDTAFSSTNLSGALSYQVNDKFFLGLEARHLRSYAGHGLSTLAGSATFFGPNMVYKINDTTTFNAVWTPQVKGQAVGSTDKLDLANFERHQFRVKLVKAF